MEDSNSYTILFIDFDKDPILNIFHNDEAISDFMFGDQTPWDEFHHKVGQRHYLYPYGTLSPLSSQEESIDQVVLHVGNKYVLPPKNFFKEGILPPAPEAFTKTL